MATRKKKREKVVITGICGALGKLLALDLHKDYDVIGVDRRPFYDRPKDINHLRLDLRRKSAISTLKKEKPDIIIHLGVLRNPLKHKGKEKAIHLNIESTSKLMNLAEKIKVRKFVFLSSANLYGPSSTSSGFLTEDTPLHGANRSPEIRDLVSLDMMLQGLFWKAPNTESVILRPVHIVGPDLNNAPSRYIRQGNVPTIMGFDPVLQLIHQDDMIKALRASLKPNVHGVYNIVGQGQAPLSRMLMFLGKKSYPVPGFVFRSLLQRAFKYHLTSFPPGELDHLKYTCLVDNQRAQKDMKFVAEKSLPDTLIDLLDPYPLLPVARSGARKAYRVGS